VVDRREVAAVALPGEPAVEQQDVPPVLVDGER